MSFFMGTWAEMHVPSSTTNKIVFECRNKINTLPLAAKLIVTLLQQVFGGELLFVECINKQYWP